MLRIAIVSGEVSGDMLGAGLINAINARGVNCHVEGIGGDRLFAAGMRILYPMERLSLIGITEAFGRYGELRRVHNALSDYFLKQKPDVFIGIDAPEFNLPLEEKLHKAGITTVHYVSPSVWAWREYRIKRIQRAVDLILNLFPFESRIYERYGVRNQFVGHPLADQLPLEPDVAKARKALALPLEKTIVAILPGSRANEIKRITGPLLQAATISHSTNNDLHFISNMVNRGLLEQFQQVKNRLAPDLEIRTYINRAHQVMEAADIVMLASGTATLEAMLLKKPMLVAYRLSWPTYLIGKLLIKTPYIAIPNILAGEKLVPEYIQTACRARALADGLNALLASAERRAQLTSRFAALSRQLGKNADDQAAKSVLELIEHRRHDRAF